MELISVIITVRDGAPHLREAIHSVLQQTDAAFELIIVNDGSRDETEALLQEERDPRIRLLHNAEPLGPFASANRALAISQGAFIARLDADDVAEPQRLATQRAHFARNPTLQVLGSSATCIDAQGQPLGLAQVPLTQRAVQARCLLDPPFVHSSVMWRAELRLAYDAQRTIAGDYALWVEQLPLLQAENLAQPLVRYRRWRGGLSHTRRAAQAQAHDALCLQALRAQGLQVSAQQLAALRAWARREDEAGEAQWLVDAIGARCPEEPRVLAPLGTFGQPSGSL